MTRRPAAAPLARIAALLALAVATGCIDAVAPDDADLSPLDATADLAPPDGGPPDAVDAAPDADAPDTAAGPCLDAPGDLDAPGFVARPLCADAPDRLRIDAPRGARVELTLEPTVDLTVTATWPDPPIEVDRLELLADERATLRWIAPDAPVTLTARSATPGVWRLTATAEPPPAEPRLIELRGRITATTRPVDLDGLGAPAPTTTAGARVDLVDLDGHLAAAARVDPDGAFRLTAHLPEPRATLRLVAQTRGADLAVRVGPDALLPWAEVVAEIDADPESADPLRIDAALDPDGPTAAALHIARVAAAGLDRIAPLLPDVVDPPPVVYRWRPGFSAPCGSCFRPGPAPVIDLGGRISDPDEWDDAVILHELGHHLAAVYSRDDSPGGPHDGDRTDPAVAWSEGFATFHAGWQLQDPVQLDYKITGVATLDLEAADDPRAYGTEGGTLDGPVSERLVAAVLWDLFDAPPADDDDAALGDETLTPVFAALSEPFAEPIDDRGAPGVDLADYLDALWCPAPPVGAPDILDDRAYPYTAPACAKAAPPLHIERASDAIIITPRLDGRLVLHDRASTTHPARVGEPITWRPQSKATFIGIELHHPAGRAVIPIRWRGADPAPRPYRRRAGAYEAAPE